MGKTENQTGQSRSMSSHTLLPSSKLSSHHMHLARQPITCHPLIFHHAHIVIERSLDCIISYPLLSYSIIGSTSQSSSHITSHHLPIPSTRCLSTRRLLRRSRSLGHHGMARVRVCMRSVPCRWLVSSLHYITYNLLLTFPLRLW